MLSKRYNQAQKDAEKKMKKQLKDMYKKIELLETLENKMHKTTNFNERLVRENEKLKKKN